MGNDNKTVSKINNLTVLCENLWPILYYLAGPLLALSSGNSRMYRKSTDKLLCEVCSLSPFYGLKLQILLLTVLLSLPINDLPYIFVNFVFEFDCYCYLQDCKGFLQKFLLVYSKNDSKVNPLNE